MLQAGFYFFARLSLLVLGLFLKGFLMGEIAEMMLDGTLCACCGDYLGDDDGWGIPSYCPGCEPDFVQEEPKKKKKVKCKHCSRTVTPNGMSDHVHDVHQKPDWWPKKKNHPTYNTKRIIK